MPDNNLEYFIYQTLIGSYPFNIKSGENYFQRIKQYLIKSMREAKEHSSWTKPDIEYESAALNFTVNLLSKNNEFFDDFFAFQKKVTFYGTYNSLSQTLIKITSPGIPDFYQGTELWDLFLVDPDNRQPVDYKSRKRFLNEIIEKDAGEKVPYLQKLLSNPSDGKIKLYLTYKSLQVRNDNLKIFNEGNFIPVETGGEFKDNLIVFTRSIDGKSIITIAPRFLTQLVKENELPLGTNIWKDTYIKTGTINSSLLNNLITGEVFERKDKLSVGKIFENFPYGLLSG